MSDTIQGSNQTQREQMARKKKTENINQDQTRAGSHQKMVYNTVQVMTSALVMDRAYLQP